jgi:hypothetical protein
MSELQSCASVPKSSGTSAGRLSDKERSIAIAKRRKKLLEPKSPYSALKPRPLPSREEILKDYDYDAALFMFFFKPSGRSRRKRAGQMAQGYIRLSVAGKSWAVHRLIWKLHTGRDPVGLIDHINGVRYDNRIENLRDVSAQANNLNKHGEPTVLPLREAHVGRSCAGPAQPDRIRYALHPTAAERALKREMRAYASALELFRDHPHTHRQTW